MAHQWTGDIVTMQWWRDTFVSEGLAQFSQRKAVAMLFPNVPAWIDDDRPVDNLLYAGVVVGAKAALQPIRTDLNADADGAFSGVTYYKGASVLEGWYTAVGAQAFSEGLQRYLRRYKNG